MVYVTYMADELDGEDEGANEDSDVDNQDDGAGNDPSEPANGNEKPRGKRNGKSGVRLSREVWERLIQAFREHGKNYQQVAKQTRLNRGTVTKAWNIGLPYEFAKIPIKDIIEQENTAARALLQSTTSAGAKAAAAAAHLGMSTAAIERIAIHAMNSSGTTEPPATPIEAELQAAQARHDAITAKAEKTKAIRLVRTTLTLGIVQTSRMANAIEKIMPRYEKALNKLLPTEEEIDKPGFKPDIECLRFMGELIRQTRDLQTTNAQLLEKVAKAEEVIIGKEDVLLGGFDGSEDEAYDEVQRLSEEARKIHEHAKQKAAAKAS